MKVLFLTQVLPYPPASGPQIKAWHVLQHLARSHQVTLLSFIRSEEELLYRPELLEYCERVEMVSIHRSRTADLRSMGRSLWSGEPFLITRDHVARMEHAVAQVMSSVWIQAIHVDQLNMAQYALPYWRVCRVLDEHNVVTGLVRRMASLPGNPLRRAVLQREARLMRRYEGEICRQFDGIVAVTEDDNRELQAIAGREIPVQTIPIGTDLSIPVRKAQPVCPHILILGTMFYPPNSDAALWFCREALPALLARLPELRVSIVGARPPRELQEMPQRFPQVQVAGFVDDLAPYFESASLLAVPLRVGGGMRVKILEAFTRGLPVVSTSIGYEGIEATPGKHLLAADDAGEFTQAVAGLIENPELASQLGNNGRRLVEEKYDWRVLYNKYDEVYRAAMARRDSRMGVLMPGVREGAAEAVGVAGTSAFLGRAG